MMEVIPDDMNWLAILSILQPMNDINGGELWALDPSEYNVWRTSKIYV